MSDSDEDLILLSSDDEVVTYSQPLSAVLSAGGSQKQSSQNSQSSSKTKKELQKEASERKREEKKLARDIKLAQLAREKELKKLENEIRKNSTPGEAHKFMTILIDESFPQFEELVQILVTAEFNYESTHPIVQNSFTFRREIFCQGMGDDLNVQKVSSFVDEDQIMILLDHEEVVPKIANQISEMPVPGHEDEIDFITFVKSIAETSPPRKCTLLLYGMESYFRKLKKKSEKEYRERVQNAGQEKKNKRRGNELPAVSRLEFQSVLVELQLETGVNFRLINTVNELATTLIQYTKAIAQAPFKQQQKDKGFNWHAIADTAGSVKIDKDGNGLSTLWAEQLCLFPNIGMDTALAIIARYPSPQHLIQAYEDCDTQLEGEALIRELNVQMGVGPLAKTRKIGPEVSKRLYRFFTSSENTNLNI